MSADKAPQKSSLSELGEKLAFDELSASEKQDDIAIDPMEIISSDDELDLILASLTAEEDQKHEPVLETAEIPEKEPESQQTNNSQPVVPPKPPALTVKTKPSVFDKLRSTLHVHKSTEDEVDDSNQQKIEQERLQKEKIKQQQLEQAKLEQAKLEQAKLEQAKLEQAKLEQAK
uniref:pentapeptide repeat-containing protein n=1 Tax=uncultured Cocleimonas sp. TaxID=1051587 RepID=UPI0026270A69